MIEPAASCDCGATPISALGVCASCEGDIREMMHPTSKDSVLRNIMATALGSTTANSLPHIARMARHGLNLKA